MFTATMNVELETVKDLFTCAIEGGSNYWCAKIRPLDKNDPRDYDDYMVDGFKAWDQESDDTWSCTSDDVKEAIQIMATQYPTHFKNALDDSMRDAETGDVFLQLCLFKKIVFG